MRLLSSALFASAAAATTLAQTYTLTDLGALAPDGESLGMALNATGTVAGPAQSDPARRLNHAVTMQNGTLTDLGLLETNNGTRSYAWGINDSGQVAGTGERGLTLSVTPTPFIYRNGRMTALPVLGFSASGHAFAVNNAGQVAGASGLRQSFGNYDTFHAVIWTNDIARDLGTLGGRYSVAYAINSSGQAVGSSLRNNASLHAFIFRNNAMTDLGTLGGRASEARDINDAGQVVGWANTLTGPTHAFLYQGTTMTDLGALGTTSDAYAINNAGDVVGTSWIAGIGPHAFLKPANGPMVDLNARTNAPGWVLQYARDINAAGQITGVARLNGRARAFLLTPSTCTADFNHDGDVGTDQDIEAFFRCLSGACCAACPPNADFNNDGNIGTDADIEAFFTVLAGGQC